MSLKVTTEPLEYRQLAMVIEADQERVDQELRKAARKAAAEYRIPGFRKGKAPYSIIAQYVGLPTLYNEFLESLGQEIYVAALEQEGIEPYARASLDVESLEPLIYKFTVPMDPKVDLGDYRSLRVEEEEITIDEAEVEQQLERYREDYAGWQNVDRPSEYGDNLTIDVRSVIQEDGAPDAEAEETVVLDESDWEVTPDQENPMEPPGFDEALLGLVPGQEKEFVLEWPADSQSIYAGKKARFTVTVKEIESYVKPDLDDDFAQLVGPDFATIDALKESVRNDLLEERKDEAKEAFINLALDALVAQADLEYPPVVVEDQLDVLMDEFERQMRRFGIEDIDDYFRQVGQTAEDYRESLREQAEITARRNLVISELYKLEGIEATDADIEQQIKTMIGEDESDSAGALADFMRSEAGRAVLESQILREKAVERLLAIVRGEELPPPAPAATEDETAEEQGVEAVEAPPVVEPTAAQGEEDAPSA